MRNIIAAAIVAAVIAGGVGFYAGTKYAPSSSSSLNGQGQSQGNGTRRNGRAGGFGAGPGGSFATGEIISKDNMSITLKLRDGGSQIVFISTSTPVMKSSSGSLKDLTAGEQVVVTGASNQDGSITAESVQIRPQLPAQNGQ